MMAACSAIYAHATVICTAGCNLACKFCQNWDIRKSRETDRLSEIASPADIARTTQKSRCRGVAFTYNDPVIFMEYAIDCAVACKEIGINAVAATAGYIGPRPRGILRANGRHQYRSESVQQYVLQTYLRWRTRRRCSAHVLLRYSRAGIMSIPAQAHGARSRSARHNLMNAIGIN